MKLLVETIWRYPVKSMLGEAVPASPVSERGLAGDRQFAILDIETGKVASAKNPRKWGKLLDCYAKLTPDLGQLDISLWDDSLISSTQPDINQKLSVYFGREVKLIATYPEDVDTLSFEVYYPDIKELAYQDTLLTAPISRGAPPGTFYNFAPVHIVTTASLKKIQELAPESTFDFRRFRPNLIIETPPDVVDFVENAWMGRTLKIGEEVEMQVIVACPRCVVTTLPQAENTLVKDEKVLRAIAKHNMVDLGAYGTQACFGVYATVTKNGVIKQGDIVELI
jgi:uncharacterized protein